LPFGRTRIEPQYVFGVVGQFVAARPPGGQLQFERSRIEGRQGQFNVQQVPCRFRG
jgi:hypothetical protein